jgi:hypothetical protein
MYEIIGFIIVLLAIVSVILVASALIIGYISLFKRVWLAGFFADVLNFFYMPLKHIFIKFAEVGSLDEWMVSLRNMANRQAFEKSTKRLLLTPHCMRSLECRAPSSKFGIECTKCGKCMFSRMKEDAERLGYVLYIVAGSSYIRHIVQKESADAALLVACNYELVKVMRSLEPLGIITYGVTLQRDGCFNTAVDYDRLLEAMKMGKQD